MTTFKILSHACLLVRTSEASIIVDPWLIGSAYWRSWWNYPEPEFDIDEVKDVDAVVISHIHWDHWHGPTLKKLFKEKLVVVGDDPNPRSINDLRQLGFDKVMVVQHGKTLRIGDIDLSFYNFGLLLNDSAIVIKTPDVKILNANDAKLAGASLRHLVNRHGHFDFALRSHSSANPRVCFSVDGDESFVADDREHYLRSFQLFMNAVKPTYAVPFASNHCHLQEDVLDFNSYVSKPSELAHFLELNKGRASWEFVPMLPGSSWSSTTGFDLRNQDAFDSYEEKIATYRVGVRDRLDHYSKVEERIQVTTPLVEKFVKMAVRAPLKGLAGVRLLLTKPSGPYKALVFDGRHMQEVSNLAAQPSPGVAVIIIPAVIFRDSILKNMFHHAGISKRCRYVASSQSDLEKLQSFVAGLELLELMGAGGVPFWRRVCIRYVARWRDLWVYALAVFYKIIFQYPIYVVEEVILRKHSGAGRGSSAKDPAA